MEQRPKTIVDIAKLAGVSKSTVSRVLNESGYVSEQSRVKVMQVVTETGFMMNEAAKTLKSQRQDTIAVIIPRIESQAVSKMVQGMNDALNDQNTNIVLGITNLELEKEVYYLHYFSQQALKGIIFMARQITPQHEVIMKQSQVPIVILGQTAQAFDYVAFDEVGGAREAATKLFSQVDTIGYIGVSTDDYAIGIERLAGVQAIAKEQQKQLTLELADFNIQSGYEATQRLLARNPKIGGIIAATDSIALGVINYLQEQEIMIGSQIKVIGFGDSQAATIVRPQLASVHYPYIEAGRQAVACLSQPNTQVKLATQLVIRHSCE